MDYFYVYKMILPETGEYYFGSRKCHVLPENDIKYKGSMCTWKPDKSKLIKEILYKDFETHQDALIKETELIIEHRDDTLNKNFSLPNGTLYLRSPKEWILKKYGEERGKEILKEISKNNSGNWKKGNKPWNTGMHLTEKHLESIRKTWHSEKRMQVMQSEEYSKKMSESLSGEKNPMFDKTIYEVWNIKYGKEIADKKYNDWKQNHKGKIPWNKGKTNRGKRCWIHNNLKKNKLILRENLEKFILDGWTKGKIH